MNVPLLKSATEGSPAMVDPFGRTISYLRVSVTDRCDLRCFYCMSEDMTFLPKADLLTLEELDRLCSAQRDVAGALAVAPPRYRCAQRTDVDDQWIAAGAFCR